MDLKLFGGFQLIDDTGNPVEIAARKTKALLAWLALHQNKNQPRDRLALLLWEESDDTQARHSLRQALSGLRKALGDHAEALIANQESVQLKSGNIQVDALQFEALLDEGSSEALPQAVSLYGGEFLEGFNPRSNTYEEWLMLQRSHYRERAIGAMSELLAHYLETNQLESGVRLAIQLLSSDPLQEQVHRALMQLYVRLNRPADALRQYRQCRRVLFRELGLVPEPETDQLYQTIAKTRTHQEHDDATPQATPETQPAAQPVADTKPKDTVATDSREKPARQLRPVTIAHLHLGSYLALISETDPEQLHQQTQNLLHQVEPLTQRYGGQLHHQHADAVVILFGLPTAHGNECEKAVQFALELLGKSTATIGESIAALGVQVGIVSGSVVCDENNSVSGGVFAQADQLAHTGQPGEIILSDAAYHGLRLAVEAIRQKDSSWQITRVISNSVDNPRGTPFIARHRELRQFSAALEASIEDRVGETFLIRGEAGLGKTRLVEEISQQAAQMGVVSHRALVLDFGTESTAEPIPTLLRQLLGVDERATGDEIKARAKVCLGSQWNSVLHHHALRALFRLPTEASKQQDQLNRETLHTSSLQLQRAILETACHSQPRLLIVEDIHWADQHTLSFLADFTSMVSRCSALLIITSRIEGEPLDPAWRSAMHGAPLSTIDLPPLREDQALKLAEQLTHCDSDFIRHCIERSGGNPFFLEQLLWGTAAREGVIPDSVQSLVLTRLDILSDEDRMAAQAASVLGQRFKLDALRQLLENSDYRTDGLLNQRLVRPEGDDFLFGHALLRDGIYASLLTSHRHALHLKAADWYRERDAVLTARHLDLADDERAADAYLHAVQQSIQAFDFEQALSLASRGTEITREPALCAQLNSLRGDLLIQAGAINKANRAFETAANLAADDQARCRALIGLATGLTVQDNLDKALKVLDQATPLAEQSGNIALQTELHYRRGDILFALARTDECLSAHQKAENLAKQSNAPLLEIRALAGMADAYYALGRIKTAGEYFDRCIQLAEREKRLPQELGNLSMRALTHFYNGSVSNAVTGLVESAKLAAEFGNLRAEMTAYINLALVSLYTEDINGAENAARRGLELAKQLGAGRFLGDNLAAIGEALVLKGEVREGIDYLERAYQKALASVPTHIGPFVLGVLARVTPDEIRQREAIAEGEQLLNQGGLSHNYLHFYQNLIEVYLTKKDADGALHYATALEQYTIQEPLPWSDFYIARGRLLAQTLGGKIKEEQRQQARLLLEQARNAGLYFGTPELEVLISK